jgi:chromosome partitioning protein
LPANIDLAGSEVHRSRTGREHAPRARHGPRHRRHGAIDCPPTLGVLTVNGLTVADGVLVLLVRSL